MNDDYWTSFLSLHTIPRVGSSTVRFDIMRPSGRGDGHFDAELLRTILDEVCHRRCPELADGDSEDVAALVAPWVTAFARLALCEIGNNRLSSLAGALTLPTAMFAPEASRPARVEAVGFNVLSLLDQQVRIGNVARARRALRRRQVAPLDRGEA